MRNILSLITFLLLSSIITGQDLSVYSTEGVPYTMVNPDIDDPSEEWCYAPKSTVVIGMPFVPEPVQVLYDASIFSGEHELCFFSGKNHQSINARQRTLYKGWIPIVQYDWTKDNIHYFIEMFSTSLPELGGAKNTLQLARFRAVNQSSSKKEVILQTATRRTGIDHRMGEVTIEPDQSFKFENNRFYRNGKMIFVCSPEGSRWTEDVSNLHDEPKENRDRLVGTVTYRKELAAEESFEFTCAFPRVPLIEQKAIQAVPEVDYEEEFSATVDYWKRLVEAQCDFEIPEGRVNDTYKAGLVHLILATRKKAGEDKKRQGSGLPYDGLFLNDFVDMRLIYDFANLEEMVKPNIDWLIDQQIESGMFVDKSLSHGQEILTSHGQALYSMTHHYIMTRDEGYASRVMPHVKKAVEWMIHEHETDEYGLLRPSPAFDAEMINGHYTSHNLWGILGVRSAIRFARETGHDELAAEWEKFHESYEASVMEALSHSVAIDFYVPPGLYSYKTGLEAREGFWKMQTNQDWENNLLAYPTEVLSVDDERVAGTVDHIREMRYREGVMTYRNGMHVHQYATLNQSNQYLAINRQKQALLDLYHVLLHNGSCHEGFENLVEPWSNRDPWPIPPPHAWAAAKTSLFIRNCLVREYGGDAGLDESERNLYLYSLLSPVWCQEGKHIEIKNAGTEFGKVHSRCSFTDGGAEITIDGEFHHQPAEVIIAVPYHKKLIDFTSDADEQYLEDGYMCFSADVEKIHIQWKDKPQVYENNYQNILKTYRSERAIAWEADKVKGHEHEDARYKMNQLNAKWVMLPKAKPFLADEEKAYEPEPLSFELVRRCFMREYALRYKEFLKKNP